MVHALHEAHRVLKPQGLLIDLRPAAEHRRVGISRRGRWHEFARLNEVLADDHAANRAVSHVVQEGVFRRVARTKFMVNRYADTLEDFRVWLDEFTDIKPCRRSPKLLDQVARLIAAQPEHTRIVIRGRLVLSLLRKT